MRSGLVWITLFVSMTLLAQAAPVAGAIPHGVSTVPAETTAAPTTRSVAGAEPVAIRIDRAGVNAPIEVVEVVNGIMQPAPNGNVVGWYRESARPGQLGNMVLTGHDVVFASVQTLTASDVILITDANKTSYVYHVEWVRTFNDPARVPLQEMIGNTPEESLTLITGAEPFDAASNAYRGYTFVRATRRLNSTTSSASDAVSSSDTVLTPTPFPDVTGIKRAVARSFRANRTDRSGLLWLSSAVFEVDPLVPSDSSALEAVSLEYGKRSADDAAPILADALAARGVTTPLVDLPPLQPVSAPQIGDYTGAWVTQSSDGLIDAVVLMFSVGPYFYVLIGYGVEVDALLDLLAIADALISSLSTEINPAPGASYNMVGLWSALLRLEHLPPGFVFDYEWVLLGTLASAAAPTPTPMPDRAETPTPNPRPTNPPTPVPAPSVRDTPTTASGSAAVLSLSGSGTNSTRTFTVSGDWDLSWSYDCRNFGFEGNFIVFVYESDGSPSVSNVGVNQLGPSGTGVEHYHAGGTYYLQVISTCSWTISVIDKLSD